MFYFNYRGDLSIIVLEVIEPYPSKSVDLLSTFFRQIKKFKQNIDDIV
jgi:hypothetical protein